jgi:hypothetical protein
VRKTELKNLRAEPANTPKIEQARFVTKPSKKAVRINRDRQKEPLKQELRKVYPQRIGSGRSGEKAEAGHFEIGTQMRRPPNEITRANGGGP